MSGLADPALARALVPALDLAPPDPGPAVVDPDAAFRVWDDVWCGTCRVVNGGLDHLAGLGLPLPRLPEQSLRELLVDPLVGDPRRLGEAADAARTAAAAAASVAASGTRVAAAGSWVWRGEAADAWAAQQAVVSARTGVVAGALEALAELLAAAAEASDRMARTVEHGIVVLGRALLRLAARLAAKATVAGWGAFALEVATKGLGAVTEIVEDLEVVHDVLAQLLGLRDDVVAWVATQEQRVQEVRSVLAGAAAVR